MNVESQETQNQLEALFSAFDEAEHALISNALYRLQDDYRGSSRILNEEHQQLFGKAHRKLYKQTEALWWSCRAAYEKKYGHMPMPT